MIKKISKIFISLVLLIIISFLFILILENVVLLSVLKDFGLIMSIFFGCSIIYIIVSEILEKREKRKIQQLKDQSEIEAKKQFELLPEEVKYYMKLHAAIVEKKKELYKIRRWPVSDGYCQPIDMVVRDIYLYLRFLSIPEESRSDNDKSSITEIKADIDQYIRSYGLPWEREDYISQFKNFPL